MSPIRSILAGTDLSAESLDAVNRGYLTIMSLNPTGEGRRRWITRWKPALNAFEGRLSAARK